MVFLSRLSVGSRADYFKGVIHGVLCMHAYTFASILLKNYVCVANHDIVNSYGGGYNAWDVPETEFVKFQKVCMTSSLVASSYSQEFKNRPPTQLR